MTKIIAEELAKPNVNTYGDFEVTFHERASEEIGAEIIENLDYIESNTNFLVSSINIEQLPCDAYYANELYYSRAEQDDAVDYRKALTGYDPVCDYLLTFSLIKKPS